jgi:hypothetical protein
LSFSFWLPVGSVEAYRFHHPESITHVRLKTESDTFLGLPEILSRFMSIASGAGSPSRSALRQSLWRVNNHLDVSLKSWPLLLTDHHYGDFPATELLRVTDVLVCCQENCEPPHVPPLPTIRRS